MNEYVNSELEQKAFASYAHTTLNSNIQSENIEEDDQNDRQQSHILLDHQSEKLEQTYH